VKIKNKPITLTSAKGTKGCLIATMGGKFMFRVYNKNYEFKDYDIHHFDMNIVIDDEDAFFHVNTDTGKSWIDYSAPTLGLETED